MDQPEIPEDLTGLTNLRKRVLYRRQKQWVEYCHSRRMDHDLATMETDGGTEAENILNNLTAELHYAVEDLERLRAALPITMVP